MLTTKVWIWNWLLKAAKPGTTDDSEVATKMESCKGKVLPLTTRPDRPVEAEAVIFKG